MTNVQSILALLPNLYFYGIFSFILLEFFYLIKCEIT